LHGLCTFVASREGAGRGDTLVFWGIEPGAANFLLGFPDREGFLGNFEFQMESLVKRSGRAQMTKNLDYSECYEHDGGPAADPGRRFSKINTNGAPSLTCNEYLAERRNNMRTALGGLGVTMAILAGAVTLDVRSAHARALPGTASLWLACENGGTYRIRPIAVSDEGDLVTGYLVRRGGRGAHVRLIPSGEGYRYAGRGVWFDGWRESVYLYLSKYRPIACTVVGEPERAKG
jgi:hypothetical protein